MQHPKPYKCKYVAATVSAFQVLKCCNHILAPVPADFSQVSDDSLLLLQEMGYSDKEAIRALRFTSSDITGAVTFLTEQREKQKVSREWQGLSEADIPYTVEAWEIPWG